MAYSLDRAWYPLRRALAKASGGFDAMVDHVPRILRTSRFRLHAPGGHCSERARCHGLLSLQDAFRALYRWSFGGIRAAIRGLIAFSSLSNSFVIVFYRLMHAIRELVLIVEASPNCSFGRNATEINIFSTIANCSTYPSSKLSMPMALLYVAQTAITAPIFQIPGPAPVRFDYTRGSTRAGILISLLQNPHARNSTFAKQLVAAEIGVDKGETSKALLGGIPNLQLLMVDPFETAGSAFFLGPNVHGNESVASSKADILWAQLIPYRGRFMMSIQNSSQAANLIAPNSLDLVFIDGNHEYPSVVQDLEVWSPKLRARGILAGHDYSVPHAGVMRAVHEFASGQNLVLNIGAEEVWWLELPGDA